MNPKNNCIVASLDHFYILHTFASLRCMPSGVTSNARWSCSSVREVSFFQFAAKHMLMQVCKDFVQNSKVIFYCITKDENII